MGSRRNGCLFQNICSECDISPEGVPDCSNYQDYARQTGNETIIVRRGSGDEDPMKYYSIPRN